MTTLTLPLTPTITTVINETLPDPFIYGWRQVIRFGPAGERLYVRVPLTLEDILHPQEDDVRMHSYEHEQICTYLNNVFQAQLAHNPAAKVLLDVRVAWDTPHVDPHTPDIAVVFGLKRQQNWATFYEAEEGTRPTLVVEVTSPATRHIDLVDKFDEYELAKLAYYILIDHHQNRSGEQRRVLGYQFTPNGYTHISPNEQGWLWLEPLGVWLAWEDDVLVCYNKIGELIPNYVQVTQERADLKAQVTKETQARTEAEARIAALEAELRRLRGEDK